MGSRTVRMLHVEDDKVQQMMIAHHLKRISELDFAITYARSETEAVDEFRRSPRDFVILDYHLSEGDGLSCLRTLRGFDTIVPIVAVSGQATDEIAGKLLESGADDYISKKDLGGDGLARSVRLALTRADAWRRRHALGEPGKATDVLRQVCKTFATLAGTDVLLRLDEFNAVARESRLTTDQLREQFESVCAEMSVARPDLASTLAGLLRPVLLELNLRLAEAGTGS
jgi:DNA-binding response OmpR family regulator